MPDSGEYSVRVADSPGVAELRLEADTAVEAGMRAFAHLADGWPEKVEFVRRDRDSLTITVSTGDDELTLIVARADSGTARTTGFPGDDQTLDRSTPRSEGAQGI